MSETEIRFCIRCGAALHSELRFGRQRPTCLHCGWVYFPDPKVAVAALVLDAGGVLLIQRNNEPKRGYWSLPGGFMDAGEDPLVALQRECLEETGLAVKVTRLVDVIPGRAHPHGADLLLVYQAEVIAGELRPGDDAGQAVFFQLNLLPSLAFESTASVLARLTEK